MFLINYLMEKQQMNNINEFLFNKKSFLFFSIGKHFIPSKKINSKEEIIKIIDEGIKNFIDIEEGVIYMSSLSHCILRIELDNDDIYIEKNEKIKRNLKEEKAKKRKLRRAKKWRKWKKYKK